MAARGTPQTPGNGERIRVLRLFSRLNIGGPARHVILLTAGLATRGYETRLIVGREAPSEGNMLALASSQGVSCEVVESFGREVRPLADLRTLLHLRRIVRDFQPHVVHTHTAKAGALGRMAARLNRTPIVVHTYHGHVLEGYFGSVRTWVFRWIERRLATLSDCLIAVSPSVKDGLVEMGIAPSERVTVVPLGLDLTDLEGDLPRSTIRRECGIAEEAPLIGIVGRLVKIKDIPTFLDAARLVLDKEPRAHFAVVGDGPERAVLEAQSRAAGLNSAVRFLGWRLDRREVYGDVDVVVNCSRNEGTPVALIEALAAGKPVVATRVGGTPDVLADGRYGRLVPAGSAPELAAAILETLADLGVARERAVAGQAAVLRQYAPQRLLDDIDRLYRDLLQRKAIEVPVWAS
jgi:glycosyltransferase involved in cell wall biosynthesis